MPSIIGQGGHLWAHLDITVTHSCHGPSCTFRICYEFCHPEDGVRRMTYGVIKYSR